MINKKEAVVLYNILSFAAGLAAWVFAVNFFDKKEELCSSVVLNLPAILPGRKRKCEN